MISKTTATPHSNVRTASHLAIYGGLKEVKSRYKEHWRKIRQADIDAIVECANRSKSTDSGSDENSPIVYFEKQFSKLTQTRHALAMNSGTAALHSAFLAVGVQPGDEVIVPAYTFFASAAPLLQLGATPVFCDIDESTLTVNPQSVEQMISPRTRAICAVHLWGNPARLDQLVALAKLRGIAVIEDCSHAHGATYQGRSVGSWGDIGCFSLQGDKPVSAGEGGVAVTNDPALYDRMLAVGHYGRISNGKTQLTRDLDTLSLGLKYRPHLYGILLATGSLSRLAALNKYRQRNYDILTEELQSCPAVSTIEAHPDAERAGFLQFVLRFHPTRAGQWNLGAFVNAVRAEGVPVSVDRYTIIGRRARLLSEAATFTQLDYRDFGGALSSYHCKQPEPGLLPVSETVADQLMTLPPFTDVAEDFVRQCGRAFCKVAEVAGNGSDLRS